MRAIAKRIGLHFQLSHPLNLCRASCGELAADINRQREIAWPYLCNLLHVLCTYAALACLFGIYAGFLHQTCMRQRCRTEEADGRCLRLQEEGIVEEDLAGD